MKDTWNDEHRILSLIYGKTSAGGFVTLYELEVESGLSGLELRPYTEDLKNKLFIVEHEEGFQLSGKGLRYCKSIWA